MVILVEIDCDDTFEIDGVSSCRSIVPFSSSNVKEVNTMEPVIRVRAANMAQTESENDDNNDLIFPATFVCLDLNIQFGSFGQYGGDTNPETDPETEPDCGANINNQENQENEKNVTGEGVEAELDDGQEDGFPINVENEEGDLPSYDSLVNVPSYDDEELNERIKNAQLQLDDKRMCIDAISAQLKIKKENIIVLNNALKAKNLKLRDAKQLVTSKSREIERTKSMINKVKNAIAVKDIDSKIYKSEVMIKSGTLCLKDENKLVGEVKELKSKRSQLALNMGSLDEFRHLLKQKDQTEKRMKNLNTEMNILTYNVSKAEAASNEIRKKYVEEVDIERKLQAQFVAAEKCQQEASEHLDSLTNLLNDKVPCDSYPAPDEIKSTSVVTDVETEETVKSVKEESDDQVKVDVTREVEQMMKNEELVEPIEIIDIEEKEQTDELMQEAIETKLKEQIQLEEKLKENAEKAQKLTEMQQAQKDAEKKEKARLKRLRKKERKRANVGDATSSSSVDVGVVAQSYEEPQQLPALTHFFSKHLKPMFTLPPMPMVEAFMKENQCRRWVNEKKSYLSPFI
ncbi:hypothetical protein QVD17_08034 [Tagetes erecta]|uniref:Uncharacterized protein n=1 Tax=Tagetes erecta TaxID=13708 RepID=A0AAD8KZR5_TARER|nr:hypothetical protein QVD17_08034 [Tagetes erecta]